MQVLEIVEMDSGFPSMCEEMEYRQLCLIRTDVDPKFLSGLGKIRIMRIGIICIGTDWDLPMFPV